MSSTDNQLVREQLDDLLEGDAGAQLIYETLCDRAAGEDIDIARRMLAYDGDFWNDFVGPMIDEVERTI